MFQSSGLGQNVVWESVLFPPGINPQSVEAEGVPEGSSHKPTLPWICVSAHGCQTEWPLWPSGPTAGWEHQGLGGPGWLDEGKQQQWRGCPPVLATSALWKNHGDFVWWFLFFSFLLYLVFVFVWFRVSSCRGSCVVKFICSNYARKR